MARVPRLSKSRFQAGLQCTKLLWLCCHADDLADRPSAAQAALLAYGHQVEERARQYFAGGVLVGHDHLHIAEALRTTRYLVDEGFSCLYEAAFEYDGAVVRSDIIVKRDEGTWMLVEVESTGALKLEHITDLAVQAYVLRGAGLAVSSCAVLHVDPEYRNRVDFAAIGDCFVLADVTAEVERAVTLVPAQLQEMKQMLMGPCPSIETGEQCMRPYTCRFHSYCHSHSQGAHA